MRKNKKAFWGLAVFGFGLSITLYFAEDSSPHGNSLTEEQIAEAKEAELEKRVATGEEIEISTDAIFPFLTEAELYAEADLVVLGTVSSLLHEYMIDTDVPFSEFSFTVDKYLKSNKNYNSSKKELNITQDGNTLSEFESYPLLEIGKQYVLFLKIHSEEDSEKLLIVGGPNGRYDIENGYMKQIGNLHQLNGISIDKFLTHIERKLTE